LNPETAKTRRRSPFMLAQEALNASDASQWAIVSNGLTLRILRDNASLTRPAYIEVDLEAVFTEELLADFTAFWLLAHASRFGNAETAPTDCPWERWRAAGQQAGVTVRGQLRYQVAEALRALGTGFLSHPANSELRAALQASDSSYDRQAFFEELLRLVYRLIFLATVEDRRDSGSGERLVFAPDSSNVAKTRYLASYSVTWLRERAVRRSPHDRYADLWQALTITFSGLASGEPALGLPALGGLFDAAECPRLDAAQLENRFLLSAVFQLGWFRADGSLSRVNYRDMGPEELGSVYESLLELVPYLQSLGQPLTARLSFVGDDESDASTRGNTRKLTGSYYTPDSLVQELVRSALEPVIEQTVKARPERPVDALLALTICDPACGSGHFLLSAARRLADEVALHRAAAEREGGAPTPADFRHALRDVVGRCVYGVDKNPMAIQLAKTALWLEAYSPDRPLSFIDHHLRVGDALLGLLDPKVLEHGIPDEAYTALSGDDKTLASALKKTNKADLKSWRGLAGGDLLTQAGLAAEAASVETLDDDTPEKLIAKRQAWYAADEAAHRSTFARLADTYVVAFLAPKVADAAQTVPLSGYLWGILSGQPAQMALEDTAVALCRRHGVFHWWLAFPQVAAQGGFSVMLGNPPWERIKLQEEEFFATRSPLVAAARNKAERAQRIEWLREGVLLHRVNPDLERAEGLSPPNIAEISLYASFMTARRGAEAVSLYAHEGRRYPLTGVGDVNTYAMFAETFLQATKATGRAGFIVPTGIATDDSTKAYFERLAVGGFLRSLLCLENEEFVFPSVHHAFRFALLTLGGSASAEAASLVFFARQPEQIHDRRRHFQLTPEEFALINPNTLTCPVFRSERDAELTKKLYRASPVLIRDEQRDSDGKCLRPEQNPWGLEIKQGLFHLTNDIRDGVVTDGPSSTTPLKRQVGMYEGKHVHQFDHRWATYVDAHSGTQGHVEAVDVTVAQKADPDFTVQPRYWTDEREVLARIARVPSHVSRAWLAVHMALESAQREAEDTAVADLLRALSQWVAAELFRGTAGKPPDVGGWSPAQAQPHIGPTESQLNSRFPRLNEVLRGEGLTLKKAVAEFPKWAMQNAAVSLAEEELAALAQVLSRVEFLSALMELLDDWMDRRSPRWLLGWRDITGVEKVRTVIASVVPRMGVAYTLRVAARLGVEAAHAACLFANLNSLIFDYVARQALGGTHLSDYIIKQLPALHPERYTAAALDFIVPRVLELTYTAHDLQPWGHDLDAYDLRPAGERGQPFAWNLERRCQLRAELDAYFARLYSLTRDELRYILDPADILGREYPSETFRVLKNNEMREYGEYRTRRLVLEAWDSLDAAVTQSSPTAGAGSIQYSSLGMIRTAEEGRLAGLVAALLEVRAGGFTVSELQSLLARTATAGPQLVAADSHRLSQLARTTQLSAVSQLLDRVRPIVGRLEATGSVVRQPASGEPRYVRGTVTLPAEVVRDGRHIDLANLLVLAEERRIAAEGASNAVPASQSQTGTK
jgi:hypothetical protein